MCYALYIGSAQELPVELAGDSDNDRFWLRAIEGENDAVGAIMVAPVVPLPVVVW